MNEYPQVPNHPAYLKHRALQPQLDHEQPDQRIPPTAHRSRRYGQQEAKQYRISDLHEQSKYIHDLQHAHLRSHAP